ncbi:hypothetical protein [Photobacterium leiognathi]|uniref:hypothetical protein n=1 Tax=Photobacterium leiognathi TaxID=553611 RepID=UPI0027394B85|nr:hypothetical protein [Photobacterium leiognathi]
MDILLKVFSYASTVIDKEPIYEEDIINILVTGFSFSGLLVLLLNVGIVFFISKRNKDKIDSIELVLKSAVEGEISARKISKYKITISILLVIVLMKCFHNFKVW